MSEQHPAGNLGTLGWGALGVGVALGLWVLTIGVLAPPDSLTARFAPAQAFPALVDFVTSQRGIDHTLDTLRRLVAGLGTAIALGILTGVTVGLSRATAQATSWVFQFLRMVSPLAWTPVAIAVFGIGDPPVFFLVFIAAMWPVILSTASGVEAVEPGWIDVARSLGATRPEIVRTVHMPAIRAHVGTGVRLALGVAWIVIVPAEMLGVDSGLGYAVLDARDRLDYAELMGIIVWIGLLGTLLDTTVRRLSRPRLISKRTHRRSRPPAPPTGAVLRTADGLPTSTISVGRLPADLT